MKKILSLLLSIFMLLSSQLVFASASDLSASYRSHYTGFNPDFRDILSGSAPAKLPGAAPADSLDVTPSSLQTFYNSIKDILINPETQKLGLNREFINPEQAEIFDIINKSEDLKKLSETYNVDINEIKCFSFFSLLFAKHFNTYAVLSLATSSDPTCQTEIFIICDNCIVELSVGDIVIYEDINKLPLDHTFWDFDLTIENGKLIFSGGKII